VIEVDFGRSRSLKQLNRLSETKIANPSRSENILSFQ
jgi:hypothetical protein